MIGVCKRLSLAIVFCLLLVGPVFAGLSNPGYNWPNPTCNSVTNTYVTWSDPNNQDPDTEPWTTYEQCINRLTSTSPWDEGTAFQSSYYNLQPDPDATISETDPAVRLVEMQYCQFDGDTITLPENAVAIKGIWADRWSRVNLLNEAGASSFTDDFKDPKTGVYVGSKTITAHYFDRSGIANNHCFVSYYVPGYSMIVVKHRPLPSQMTVYRIPVEPGYNRVMVNPEIFRLDPDKYGFRTGGDPTNNLLGVFDNAALKKPDYTRSADLSTGRITINDSPSSTRYMYVAVSTFAVEGLTYGKYQNVAVQSYDPDTGEIGLVGAPDNAGDPVTVEYRPLGRTKVTLGMAPVTDLTSITDPNQANHVGRKQFDGATGRVVLDPSLDWGTRCLTAKYTCVDINHVTSQNTWEFTEGGKAHPIVRESDDVDGCYCTLQPDPVDEGQKVTIGVDGLYHGVQRVEYEGGFSEVTIDKLDPNDLAGSMRAYADTNQTGVLLRHAAADDKAGTPEVKNDEIMTRYDPVWIKELIIANPDGTYADWGPHCKIDNTTNGKPHIIDVDPKNPLPDKSQIVYITYWAPGLHEVLVLGPAPMPDTVHVYSLDGFSQPHTDMLRINTNLLYMDPDYDMWRGEALGGAAQGFNILGVYDNANLNGWNYFTPGPNMVQSDASNASVLQLNMVPADAVGTLYMKVSTYAIDGVWTDQGSDAMNRYPGKVSDPVAQDSQNNNHLYEWYDPAISTSMPYSYASSDADTTLFVAEVHPAQELDYPGQQVYVTHRALSQKSMTPARGPVMAVPQLRVINPYTNTLVELQGKLVAQPPVWSVGLDPSDPTAAFPLGTQMLYDITYHAGMCISGLFPSAVYTNGLQRWGGPIDCQPMYPTNTPGLYWLSVSEGLNMSNPRQQPRYDLFDSTDICLLRDYNQNPIDFAPALVCNQDGSAAMHAWSFVAATHPAVLGTAPTIDTAGPVTTTVHCSTPGRTISYGGPIPQGCDVLTNYPGKNWPVSWNGPDPLIPMSPSAVVPLTINPDNGSSSTTFDFRVRYTNSDNLAPKPWFPQWVDLNSEHNTPSGVVLYFDLMDVFDLGADNRNGSWRPFFMQPEDPSHLNYAGGVDYIYRMQPCDMWSGQSTPVAPTQMNGNAYVSLMVGTYHYFFGCTDDSLDLGYGDETYLLANQYVPDGMSSWLSWGNVPSIFRVPLRSSTGLDPHTARTVTDGEGRPFMPRAMCRRYSAFGDDTGDPQDWQIYVDRYDRVPGMFENINPYEYPWKSICHPEVTVALSGFSSNDTDGFGRFYGTVKPFYRAVNPTIDTPWGAGGLGWMASRMETCGATQSTTLTFKVKYFQRDNKAPNWIKVFVNGAAVKQIDPAQEMKPENGNYIGYTMQPCAIQSAGQNQKPPYDYTTGVDYEFKTQLPPGPHTYFFMANDGIASVIYPARPDDWNYGGAVLGDNWIPSNRGDNMPTLDNNYCPGPYINHPCEVASATVDPATGIEGQQFTYRVLYRDADGQRPYQTKIFIDTGTNQGVIAADMLKEDPSANNYVNGVWYVFNTATLDKFAMADGVRRYRFEFIDDWGRPSDVNDVVKGETTYMPNSGGWIDGPTIGAQARPTLISGKVISTDGTSNGATLWKFAVTYKDINNDAPKFVTLYVGRLLSDGQTIHWDNGHQMAQSDPSDKTYYDGAEFIYQTRLQQALNPTDPNQIYYYAFEASDGVQLAVYVPQDYPDVNARSESAGCELHSPLTTDDYTLYRSNRVPLVGTLPNQPTNAGILIDPVVWCQVQGLPDRELICCREDSYVTRGEAMGPRNCGRDEAVDAAYLPPISEVEGVYLNPDLTGTDYFHSVDAQGLPTMGSYDPNIGIVLAQDVPYGTNHVWIKYRHDSNFLYVCGVVASGDDPMVVVRANDIDPNNAPEIHEIMAVYAGSLDLYHGLDGSAGSYDAATRRITLKQMVPSGTAVTDLQVVYRTPTYTLDRWTGEVTFSRPQNDVDQFKADYFFATRHMSEIASNIPPTIYGPKLTPMVGSSGSNYVYTVTYKETEGPNGQAPAYVRVVIDGVEHDMAPVFSGNPSYRAGVTYTYSVPLQSGSHNYYFTASDGQGMVTLPQADPTTGRVQPLLGPWVNDPPKLTNGVATPNPAGMSIPTLQPVNYTVVYSDPDNDAPITYHPFAADANASDTIKQLGVGTPLLFIDNPSEAWNVGTVAEIVEDPAQPGKHRSIKVCDKTGQPAHYTADQFAGKLLQFVSGTLAGRLYLIANNTTDELKLMTDDLVDDGLTVDTPFTIAAFQMFKADPSQQNYTAGVTYSLRVPQLAEGLHKFHFEAASAQTPPDWVGAPYLTQTQSAWIRYASAGEISGPTAAVQAPDTNHIPILSMLASDGTGVSPASGKSTDEYDFFVTYRDADGDPPRYHDGALGYIRVVFDDGSYAADMRPEVAEDQFDPNFYMTNRRFTVSSNGLPEGEHKFHFEASDGWVKVRYPDTAQGSDPTANDPKVVVNVKAKLTNISVTPPNGDTNTKFVISVNYSDINNQGPHQKMVSGKLTDEIWVELNGDSTNKLYLTRDVNSGNNFVTGVTYTATKTGLGSGQYTTAIKANDFLQEAISVAGPTISISANQNAPTLTSPKVYNTSATTQVNGDANGGTTNTFKYEVQYSDADGDMPFAVQGTSVVEGVKLYIDGVFEAVVTQGVATAHLENGKPDYTKPVTYSFTRQGSKYAGGQHTYYFEAKDGTSDDAHVVRTDETSGPNILSATLSLTRKVSDGEGSWVDKDPKIADAVRIDGYLTEAASKPIAGGQTFTIVVTRPDGTTSTTTVTGATQATGSVKKNEFTYDLEIPMQNSQWTVTAKWNGNADYTQQVTGNVKIDVKGPTRVLATADMTKPSTTAPSVDMVTMLLTPTNGDAGAMFGFDKARMMQIVRWDPEQRTYLWYGDTYFPPITPGTAVWVLPSALYPYEAVSATNMPSPADSDYPIEASKQYRLFKPSGKLFPQENNCEIQLKAGWNQIGSPFLLPTDISRAQVICQDKTVSIDQAATNGWIRNYAWMWDPVAQRGDRLIHATRPDAYSRSFEPWRGYWIKAMVNCTLVLASPTSATTAALKVAEEAPMAAAQSQELDAPPSSPLSAAR